MLLKNEECRFVKLSLLVICNKMWPLVVLPKRVQASVAAAAAAVVLVLVLVVLVVVVVVVTEHVT